MKEHGIEDQVARHYRALIEPRPERLQRAVDAVVDGAPLKSQRLPGSRTGLSLALTGVVALTLGIALLLGGRSEAGPGGPPGAGEASATALPKGSTDVIDLAGTIPSVGFWAISHGAIRISIDGGATWANHQLPSLGSGPLSDVRFTDAKHGWIAVNRTGGPEDAAGLSVAITSDGGLTWTESSMPAGACSGWEEVASFTGGPQTGYLLCRQNTASGATAVLATADEGRSWVIVGTESGLGSLDSMSETATLWAGAGAGARNETSDLLAVSRDGGTSWQSVNLSGLVSSGGLALVAPVFSDPQHGVLAVFDGSNSDHRLLFVRTSDGGRTWTLATNVHAPGNPRVVILDQAHWIVATPGPEMSLSVTTDGGRSWQTVTGKGAINGQALWLGFSDPIHGAAVLSVGDGTQSLCVTQDGGARWTCP